MKKLALYSDQSGHPDMDARLLQLMGCAAPRIGYIASAPDPQRVYFGDRRRFYAGVGARLAVYVDELTAPTDDEWNELLACDAIHLSGGNTFHFHRWLVERGVFAKLRAFADQGGVLIGVSAGAILMTPDTRAAALCGDQRSEYADDDRALARVNFHFWPHFTDARPDGETVRLAAELVPLYCCGNGSGVIVEDNLIEVFGAVKLCAVA